MFKFKNQLLNYHFRNFLKFEKKGLHKKNIKKIFFYLFYISCIVFSIILGIYLKAETIKKLFKFNFYHFYLLAYLLVINIVVSINVIWIKRKKKIKKICFFYQ